MDLVGGVLPRSTAPSRKSDAIGDSPASDHSLECSHVISSSPIATAIASSPSMSHDVDSDAEYARRLQDEELSLGAYQQGAGNGAAPRGGGGGADQDQGDEQQRRGSLSSDRPLLRGLGAAALAQPEHREVHLHAREQANVIQEHSIVLLGVFLGYGLIELILGMVVLAEGWHQYCDKPLRIWVLVYCGRWLAVIPLTLARWRRRHIQYSVDRPDWRLAYLNWIKFLAFVFMILGQVWYFTSTDCTSTAPWVAKYTLALIILFYISLFSPIIILLIMCLCLPCALILMRVLQVEPGAAPDVISALPKRVFHVEPPAPGQAPPADAPSCAICMEDYKEGEELRHLRCDHEFHVSCVDKWLAMNHSCPLCRKSVIAGPEEAAAENV